MSGLCCTKTCCRSIALVRETNCTPHTHYHSPQILRILPTSPLYLFISCSLNTLLSRNLRVDILVEPFDDFLSPINHYRYHLSFHHLLRSSTVSKVIEHIYTSPCFYRYHWINLRPRYDLAHSLIFYCKAAHSLQSRENFQRQDIHPYRS